VILWRVSRHVEINGAGGLRSHGRWHSRGRRIVYCTENPATALLETLVHGEIDIEDKPDHFDYDFLEIEAPDSISLESITTDALPAEWQKHPGITQSLGNNWLRSAKSAILAVPCVIVPKTVNFLINPAHPEAESIRVIQVHRHPRDFRLPAQAQPG
jgi:RES domain-containing protein